MLSDLSSRKIMKINFLSVLHGFFISLRSQESFIRTIEKYSSIRCLKLILFLKDCCYKTIISIIRNVWDL